MYISRDMFNKGTKCGSYIWKRESINWDWDKDENNSIQFNKRLLLLYSVVYYYKLDKWNDKKIQEHLLIMMMMMMIGQNLGIDFRSLLMFSRKSANKSQMKQDEGKWTRE